jgi:hypothetical protein
MSGVLLLLAACGQRAVECPDGRYCPDGTSCGGNRVCLADPGACGMFSEGTPCAIDPARGYCRGGTCAPGILVIGSTAAFPGHLYVDGTHASVRGHPEIIAGDTNRNGFFDVHDAPVSSSIVIDLQRDGTIAASTRAIQLGTQDMPIDSTYGEIPLVDLALIEMVAAEAGVAFDPAHGIVIGAAFDADTNAPLADVAADLAGASCVGPLYLDAALMPGAGAKATLAESGVFAFIDCIPGSSILAATRAGSPCSPVTPAPQGDLVVEITAGRLVYAGRFDCP